MKSKKEKIVRSALRLQAEHNLDDDEMGFIPEEFENRDSTYKRKFITTMGKPVYTEISQWFQGLSPREKEQAKGKDRDEKNILLAFVAKNQNHPILTHGNIKKIQKAVSLKDDRFEPIRSVERDEETGELRPAKIVVERKAPHIPTQKEMRTMSVKDIAKAIEAIRDYNWPSGGGDSEVSGIEGISE